MTDFTREGGWKNMHNTARIVRKSSSCVMSATPKKTKDRHSKKQQLQILWSKRCFWRRKSIIWKIFAVGKRRNSVGLILVECCGSIGSRDENLSERVCGSCGQKIRNAAELHSFIEQALCSTRVDEDLNCKASKDRCKRQLPTTITPERSNTKKTAYRNRRLLRFVTFVHLPFFVRSLNLFVASLVFMSVYKGHFMSCYKEECYALANFKRS